MFEEIKTLSELNGARAQMCKDAPMALQEINNAYNVRRKEILTMKTKFKQLNKFPYRQKTFPVLSVIPYAGQSPKASVIATNEAGFLV